MKLTAEQYRTIIDLLKTSDSWVLRFGSDDEIYNTCSNIMLYHERLLSDSLICTIYDSQPKCITENVGKFEPTDSANVLLSGIVELPFFKSIVLWYYMFKVIRKLNKQKNIQDEIDRNKREDAKIRDLNALLPKIKECVK